MKRLAILLTMACFLGIFSGCNTIAGVGKDLERGGEKLQEKARNFNG